MYIKYILRLSLLLIVFLSMTVLVSCGKQIKKSEPVLSTTSAEQQSEAASEESTSVSDEQVQDDVFDESKIDTYVILNDANTTINGAGATFENNILTISDSGTYSISGQLADGKIYVNSNDEEKKVKIYLNGVTVNCNDDAPLFVENSPKETILILADSTVNTFTDSAERTVPTDGSDYATATIYSKDDLQIEGSGTLEIKANFNKGIFSKNDIDIRGGSINITSTDDGIRGKESVDVSGGNINITCGGDGIRTSEETETDKGDINISGGNINITSDLDGIQAVRNLAVSGGKISVTSGGGASETTAESPMDDMGSMQPGMGGERGGRNKGGIFDVFGKGGNHPGDSSTLEASTEDTPSMKGIKATGSLTFSEGTISIDSADDSIHGNSVDIQKGTFSIKSTDDGIHADANVKIGGGIINISMSYEGIEGQVIDIADGTINLVSADDGFNAASQDSSSSMGGGPGMMQADSSCQINISGGYVQMNAEGDGVDSNGNVDMTDGTVIVFGPQSGGNGALDYAGKFNISGGTMLALGSAGMAQTVTGTEDVKVYAYNYSQQANTLSAITDGDGEVIIAFKSPKAFQTMVLASDEIDSDDVCTLYQDGTIDEEGTNNVWLEGKYTPGTEIGVLS